MFGFSTIFKCDSHSWAAAFKNNFTHFFWTHTVCKTNNDLKLNM